jgi:diketogulonate reductase-like aldo/keto reductase
VEQKTEADYEKLVQKSLTNLQTDYIDLYLIHWPGKLLCKWQLLNNFRFDDVILKKKLLSGVTGLANDSPDVIEHRHMAWKALTKAHKAGLIRSIGVSNFGIKHLEELKKANDVVPALNQVEWNPKI